MQRGQHAVRQCRHSTDYNVFTDQHMVGCRIHTRIACRVNTTPHDKQALGSGLRLRLGVGLRLGFGSGFGVGYGYGYDYSYGYAYGLGLGLGFGLGVGSGLGLRSRSALTLAHLACKAAGQKSQQRSSPPSEGHN